MQSTGPDKVRLQWYEQLLSAVRRRLRQPDSNERRRQLSE